MPRLPPLAWNRAVQKFAKNVTVTQYSTPSAVSGYAPSKGADTTPVSIRAAFFPVITEELSYLFEGSFDAGDAAMLISNKEVSQDINTGDRITYNSIKYKVTKVTDWTNLGKIKAYSLKRETV